MYAQAVRIPPVHLRGKRILSSASEQCAKGCAFPDVQLDCIKYLKLGEIQANSTLYAVYSVLSLCYGQEDYVFGDSDTDARHWSEWVLKALRENQDTLEALFN